MTLKTQEVAPGVVRVSLPEGQRTEDGMDAAYNTWSSQQYKGPKEKPPYPGSVKDMEQKLRVVQEEMHGKGGRFTQDEYDEALRIVNELKDEKTELRAWLETPYT